MKYLSKEGLEYLVPKIKSIIPTSTDELINDSGFITSEDIAGKQDTLVSGENIKTVGGESILGQGNIETGEKNKLETIKVNGRELEMTDKSVDISVPTLFSQISQDTSAVSIKDHNSSHTEAVYTWTGTKAEYKALNSYNDNWFYYITDDSEETAGIVPDLLDIFYPVGTYYETSDISFNPNLKWGGIWVEDTAGRVTVAQDSSDISFDTLGETGGEKTHTLTTNEMPSHTHELHGALTGQDVSIANTGNDWAQTTTSWSSDNWIKSTGGGQPHNNLQPYIVVKRWHRTA